MSVTEPMGALVQELRAAQAQVPAFDLETLQSERDAISGQIGECVDKFVRGETSLETFRSELDKRTRHDWDILGLKGMSCGMVLNKLAKYFSPRRAELETRLRAVLAVPASREDGVRALRSFLDWIASCIEQGLATRGQLQPRRIPTMVSTLWHVRAPAKWPAFFESHRSRLLDADLFAHTSDFAGDYGTFARIIDRLRDELNSSPLQLERILTWAPPAARESVAPPAPPTNRTWLWAAGRAASEWPTFRDQGIAGIGFLYGEDLRQLPDLEAVRARLSATRDDGKVPMNDSLAAWQVTSAVRVGDTVYVKKGRSQVVGRGTVTSEYRFDAGRKPFPHVCGVKWEWEGVVDVGETLVMKTLTDITAYSNLVARLATLTGAEEEGDEAVEAEQEGDPAQDAYTIEHAALDLFWPRSELESWVDTLRRRKNLILQGPPGVGKTFVASRLADLLIGRKAASNKVTVQFHPSYGYEDFVQGYRPTQEGGYQRVNGPFLELCQRALQDPEDTYVVIIDEINRAHLGKVLGELMMLIEADKRSSSWAASLAYAQPGEQPFHVPPNLHIIGTMNSADRSLALVDYALRRRFAFVELAPAFGEAAFERFLEQSGVPAPQWKRLSEKIVQVNKMLEDDPSLGSGYLIGHSFFCSPPASAGAVDEWFADIVEQDLLPLLREYWFDQRTQLDKASGVLVET